MSECSSAPPVTAEPASRIASGAPTPRGAGEGAGGGRRPPPVRGRERGGARAERGGGVGQGENVSAPPMAEVETLVDDAVLTITLNRPDVLNALNGAMHAQL